MKKIAMPFGARYIIEQLNKHGFEAYIVGGCVRDSLLQKYPHDWDITTSAKPMEIKKIFRRTVDTGIQHGTVTVLVDKKILKEGVGKEKSNSVVEHLATEESMEYAFEVTTYRVDGVYEDHRRPKEVVFTASLEEDLKRRDFTINAMAYNDDRGVIDIFGGEEDLKRGVIRCVGNPSDRFDEDALRILRAVRFAAQLGFQIDDDTRQAMKEQAKFLADISAERIQVELTKLITSENPGRLREAYELGLTKIFLPEFDAMMETGQNNPNHLYSVGIHTVKVMENIKNTVILRYTALLHDVGKPPCKTMGEDGLDHFYGHQAKSKEMAEIVLRRLKLDNNTIDSVCRLVLYHDYGIGNGELSNRAFRRFLAKLGVENFTDFISMRRADMAGQSDYRVEEKAHRLKEMETMYQEVIDEKQCLKISDLAIGGKDLIALGIKPGVGMGKILKNLLEQVLDDPQLNTREKLLALVENGFRDE